MFIVFIIEMKSKFVGEITRALWKERTKQGLGLCVSALKMVNPLEWILTQAINQVNVTVPIFVWVHPLFGLFTLKLGDFVLWPCPSAVRVQFSAVEVCHSSP
jgi:hypothetical protein